jgi:vacuolar-type H+-ATPase subunit I/STV1
MGNDNDSITPNGQTPESVTSTGQTANSTDQPGSGTQKTPIESLPSDAQDFIKRLIDENKSYRKRAQDQERAAQTAQEQRLKEQGEFKQLAEKHEARVKELEPVASRYDALATLVTEQIDAEIKDWPATVKALDPGADAGIEVRLAWRNKARAIVTDLQQQARSTQPGNAPSPRPASLNGSKDVDELRTRYRESGKYGF